MRGRWASAAQASASSSAGSGRRRPRAMAGGRAAAGSRQRAALPTPTAALYTHRGDLPGPPPCAGGGRGRSDSAGREIAADPAVTGVRKAARCRSPGGRAASAPPRCRRGEQRGPGRGRRRGCGEMDGVHPRPAHVTA